jgi:hypothetical protein
MLPGRIVSIYWGCHLQAPPCCPPARQVVAAVADVRAEAREAGVLSGVQDLAMRESDDSAAAGPMCAAASATMIFFVVMSISCLSSNGVAHSRHQIVGGLRAGGCGGNHTPGV